MITKNPALLMVLSPSVAVQYLDISIIIPVKETHSQCYGYFCWSYAALLNVAKCEKLFNSYYMNKYLYFGEKPNPIFLVLVEVKVHCMVMGVLVR